MAKKVICNERGDGLISTMMAMAIAAVVIVAGVTIITTFSKVQVDIKKLSNLESSMLLLNSALNQNLNLCDTKSGGVMTPVSSGSEEYTIASINMGTSVPTIGPVGSTAPGVTTRVSNWNIKSIQIKNFSESSASMPGIHNANLVVEYNQVANEGLTKIQKLPLLVKREGTKITECYSFAGYNNIEQQKTELASFIEEIRIQMNRSFSGIDLCDPGFANGAIMNGTTYNAGTKSVATQIKLSRTDSTDSNIIIGDPTFSSGGAVATVAGWEVQSLGIGEISADKYPISNYEEANLILVFKKTKPGLTEPFIKDITYRVPLIIHRTGTSIDQCYSGIPDISEEVCLEMGWTWDKDEDPKCKDAVAGM